MTTKTHPDVPMAVLERLERGEFFNAYSYPRRGYWIVGIGPITDFVEIGRTSSNVGANLLVDSLRVAFDQPAQLVKAEDYE